MISLYLLKSPYISLNLPRSPNLSQVLLNLFHSLFSEGFCTKPDADPDGDKGGEGSEGTQLDDDVEGTGMGQGEGKKDVSDELQEG